jgi:hypothetical protein
LILASRKRLRDSLLVNSSLCRQGEENSLQTQSTQSSDHFSLNNFFLSVLRVSTVSTPYFSNFESMIDKPREVGAHSCRDPYTLGGIHDDDSVTGLVVSGERFLFARLCVRAKNGCRLDGG